MCPVCNSRMDAMMEAINRAIYANFSVLYVPTDTVDNAMDFAELAGVHKYTLLYDKSKEHMPRCSVGIFGDDEIIVHDNDPAIALCKAVLIAKGIDYTAYL